uniref:Uncharacterized protein n=1 Tax=Hanusia phi TaxID=3032 RepID=A0A7S0HDI2_9CRYP|eukprot:759327-Hanusia_phi.AAC.4
MQAIANANTLLSWVEQFFVLDQHVCITDEQRSNRPFKDLRPALRRGCSECKGNKKVTFCVEITNSVKKCSESRLRKNLKLSACTRRRSSGAVMDRSFVPY